MRDFLGILCSTSKDGADEVNGEAGHDVSADEGSTNFHSSILCSTSKDGADEVTGEART